MYQLGDATAADLSSPAKGGEYLRFVWKVQLNLLPWQSPILNAVKNKLIEMRDDPSGPFVAVAGPDALAEGTTILGYGAGYITASVKLSARAAGRPISALVEPFRCINVLLSKAVAPAWQWFDCTVELIKVWRIAHLYDAEGVAGEAADKDKGPLDPFSNLLDKLRPVLYVGGALVALAYIAPFLPRPARRE